MNRAALLSVIIVASLVPLAAAQTVTLSQDSGSVEISYQAQGVDVQDVKLESDTLVFDVNAFGDPGSFVVVLDRNVLDATEDGSDIEYLVIIDDFPNFNVIESETTETSRTLRIPVQLGSTEIEIVGTAIDDQTSTPDTLDTDVVDDDAIAGDTIDDDTVAADPATGDETVADPTTGDVIAANPADDATADDETIAADPSTADIEIDDAMTGGEEISAATPASPPAPAPDDVMTAGPATTLDMSAACGSGTVLGSDGQTCVPAPKQSIPFKDLGIGAVAGFIVSFIVMMFLYPFSRLRRRS